MVSRVWRATGTTAGAAAYAKHFHGHVLPSMARIDGFQGAMLLQRAFGRGVELVVVSFWLSEQAIHAFAGPDADRAVVADEARRVLEYCDDAVTHFTVVAQDAIQFMAREW
jgi:heme-degrading monooxygenase HmoA